MEIKIRNYSFFRGVLLGFIIVLMTTIIYVYSPALHLSKTNSTFYLTLFTLVLCPIMILKYMQFHMTQYAYSFKLCFSIIFLIIATALLLIYLYYYIVYNFVAIDLFNELICYQYEMCLASSDCDMSLEAYMQFYKDKYFSFYGQIQQWIFSLIPCTLYSAIICLFMKK